MAKLLRTGDVFLIEKGQDLYLNRDEQEVRAGEPTSHQEYKQDEVTVKGKKFYSKDRLVTIQHVIPPVGEYVVLRTSFEGGGTGHGPGDVYPDGHKVVAKPLKGKGPTVSFYQSGCFTAMLENPKRVGRAVTSTTPLTPASVLKALIGDPEIREYISMTRSDNPLRELRKNARKVLAGAKA